MRFEAWPLAAFRTLRTILDTFGPVYMTEDLADVMIMGLCYRIALWRKIIVIILVETIRSKAD